MHARPVAALVAFLAASTFAPAQPTTPSPASSPEPSDTPLITESPFADERPPASIPTSHDPSLTALENAVLAAHDVILAAIESRNLHALAASHLETNRGAMIVDGRMTLTRDDVLNVRQHEFAQFQRLNYGYTQRHVTMLSATSALLVGTGTATGTVHDGSTFEHPFAHTLVFMNSGGAWKVVHWHASTPRPHLGG